MRAPSRSTIQGFLYDSVIRVKQYGGQVHLFRKRNTLQKVLFPRLKVRTGAQQSLRDLVQTFLRSGQITIMYLSLDGKRVTFPFPEHMAALLETVPEPQTVLSG